MFVGHRVVDGPGRGRDGTGKRVNAPASRVANPIDPQNDLEDLATRTRSL